VLKCRNKQCKMQQTRAYSWQCIHVDTSHRILHSWTITLSTVALNSSFLKANATIIQSLFKCNSVERKRKYSKCHHTERRGVVNEQTMGSGTDNLVNDGLEGKAWTVSCALTRCRRAAEVAFLHCWWLTTYRLGDADTPLQSSSWAIPSHLEHVIRYLE